MHCKGRVVTIRAGQYGYDTLSSQLFDNKLQSLVHCNPKYEPLCQSSLEVTKSNEVLQFGGTIGGPAPVSNIPSLNVAPTWATCTSGEYIPYSYLCDSYADCSDSSDEIDCRE